MNGHCILSLPQAKIYAKVLLVINNVILCRIYNIKIFFLSIAVLLQLE